MYLADYHTHTRVSQDASRSMTEMAEAALAAGLDEICFTDHMEPVEWESTRLRASYPWDHLASDFREAQAAMGDRIRLRLGIELGDAVWGIENTERLLAQAPPLDFIIGSVHMLSPAYGGQDLYYFDPPDEAAALAGIRDYLDQVRKMVDWGGFSVLGHMTLPLRYLNENRGFRLTFDPFEEEAADIFRTLIGKGLGIELNTNRGNTPLPDEKLLRLYRALGGEIITLGTDAHRRRDVGRAIREDQALLRRCGFRRFCTFDQGEPVWHELE